MGRQTPHLTTTTDHDLLLEGRRATIAENRAAAHKWAVLVEFYRRRVRDYRTRLAESPHFALTARQEVVVEVGELWAVSVPWLRTQLNVALFLAEHVPEVWQLCLDGKLDTYRARLIADAGRTHDFAPETLAGFAKSVTAFCLKHLRGVDELEVDDQELVCCTTKQLRNRLSYLIRKLRPAEAEERFRRKYADRAVRAREDPEGDGMGWLSVNGTIDKVRLAEQRLTLAAEDKRARGDDRTLDQLRADLAIDLLIGRSEGAPVPTYARPVVNLTVPVQTVMGLADDPGVLSGGTVVPAGLARMIAQSEDATWHRMLTDPAGEMRELSTKSYRPTKAIWQHVVAEYGTCFRPGCDAPATQAELDHRVSWPQGLTDTANLWPGCSTDHKAKHAPGFAIEQDETGSFVLKTAAGLRHRIARTAHPSSGDFALADLTDPDGDRIQFSATEIVEALGYLHNIAMEDGTDNLELLWEEGCEEALDDVWEDVYVRPATGLVIGGMLDR